MNKVLALLLLVAFAFSATAQNQLDKQGRKQGHWLRVDKNGAKIYEGDFKDGLEVGTFQYYYPNGNIRIRNVYSVPGRYCSHEAYDEQGHLLAKGFYNQKNRDSVWHIYNEQGRLLKIATYRMGVRQGAQIIFNSNGDTAEYSMWRDNHRDGRWWKRVGEKGYITGTFVKGGLEGRLVEYDEQGKLCREGYYVDGEKHGAYRYYEGGVLTVDEQWYQGLLQSRKVLLTVNGKGSFYYTGGIAYFYPRGEQTVVITMQGETLRCSEDCETLFARIGMENFQYIDIKNRVVGNTACLLGLTKDDEGRDILLLEPQLPFSVFPDEDCLKLLKSVQRPDQLDE